LAATKRRWLAALQAYHDTIQKEEKGSEAQSDLFDFMPHALNKLSVKNSHFASASTQTNCAIPQ
jgi:hypothetical protein